MRQGQRQPYRDGASRMTPGSGSSTQVPASAHNAKPVRICTLPLLCPFQRNAATQRGGGECEGCSLAGWLHWWLAKLGLKSIEHKTYATL